MNFRNFIKSGKNLEDVLESSSILKIAEKGLQPTNIIFNRTSTFHSHMRTVEAAALTPIITRIKTL